MCKKMNNSPDHCIHWLLAHAYWHAKSKTGSREDIEGRNGEYLVFDIAVQGLKMVEILGWYGLGRVKNGRYFRFSMVWKG